MGRKAAERQLPRAAVVHRGPKVVPVRFGWLGGHSPGSGRFRAPDLDRIPKTPLVSCLCVTENRHAFLPWLLWNYDRQDWPRRELVIIDSSEPPLVLPKRRDVRVMHVPPGTSLGKKRNLAMDLANGEVIAWFDDDDWQHSRRLSSLVPLLRESARRIGASFIGPSRGFFIDVHAARAEGYRMCDYAIFNGSVYYREMVNHARFSEQLVRSEDTRWISTLLRDRQGAALIDEHPPLFMWLSHAANVTNRTELRRLNIGAQGVIRHIGRAWGDTPRQLAALRSRLESQPATRPVRDLMAESREVRTAGRQVLLEPRKPALRRVPRRTPDDASTRSRCEVRKGGKKATFYLFGTGARPPGVDPRFLVLPGTTGRGLSGAFTTVVMQLERQWKDAEYVGILRAASEPIPTFDACLESLEQNARGARVLAVASGRERRERRSLAAALAGIPGAIHVARALLVRRLGLPERVLSVELAFPDVGFIAAPAQIIEVARDYVTPARVALQNRYDEELRELMAAAGAGIGPSLARTTLVETILELLPSLMTWKGTCTVHWLTASRS